MPMLHWSAALILLVRLPPNDLEVQFHQHFLKNWILYKYEILEEGRVIFCSG